jgi:hypothetical protein
MAQTHSNTRRRTSGWLVHPYERCELLKHFQPAYADVIAHHVTLASGFEPIGIPQAVRSMIVGHADDGRGVEALIVQIDGTTDRPDGGTYHITWSLDRAANREARESNDVIARFGWRPIEQQRPVELMPAYWEREYRD